VNIVCVLYTFSVLSNISRSNPGVYTSCQVRNCVTLPYSLRYCRRPANVGEFSQSVYVVIYYDGRVKRFIFDHRLALPVMELTALTPHPLFESGLMVTARLVSAVSEVEHTTTYVMTHWTLTHHAARSPREMHRRSAEFTTYGILTKCSLTQPAAAADAAAAAAVAASCSLCSRLSSLRMLFPLPPVCCSTFFLPHVSTSICRMFGFPPEKNFMRSQGPDIYITVADSRGSWDGCAAIDLQFLSISCLPYKRHIVRCVHSR